MSGDRTVVFVCLHGMGMSRLAAALFNHVAPTGWRAVSAGLTPGVALSPTAANLLEGTPAEPFLDRAAPRGLEAVDPAARMIAVSNPHLHFEIPGAETWRLHSAAFDEPMREEIRGRVNALAGSLRGDCAD